VTEVRGERYPLVAQTPHARGPAARGEGEPAGLKQDIPLTDDERAAVDDGLEALEKLCAQLTDMPTPAGPTARQLASGGA